MTLERMPDLLAAFVWFLIAFALGIVPAAWLIANDQIVGGIAAGIVGYGLGGLGAEALLRWIERDPGR